MEYKTYVQKLPTLQASYNKDTGIYHVKSENGESDVPKDIFESSWREQTYTEVETSKVQESINQIVTQALITALNGGDITALKSEYTTAVSSVPHDVALAIPEIFPVWSANSVKYKAGDKVSYKGVLYKVLQDHTSQESWKPDVAPSLFAKMLTSPDNTPKPWVQPDSTNAYKKGDRVTYNGKIYESLIDNNVWSPDGYPAGWKEVEEG